MERASANADSSGQSAMSSVSDVSRGPYNLYRLLVPFLNCRYRTRRRRLLLRISITNCWDGFLHAPLGSLHILELGGVATRGL